MYSDKKTRSVYAGAHHVEENILPVFAGLLGIQAGIVLFLVLQITRCMKSDEKNKSYYHDGRMDNQVTATLFG